MSSTSSTSSPLTSEFLASVSHGPGVYQMLGRKEVLYVGKARDLRKRLSQYAHFSGSAHSKTGVMLSQVKRVETILTTTEKEALILEASLIKKHRPRYNVILRDDKNYPLIKISLRDHWPRVSVTRKRLRDGNRYFGPYSSTSGMRATLKLLYSQFPLRRCKTVRERERPCLNYQMGRCLAPCAGKVSHHEYMAMVKEVILILEGKASEVIEGIEKKMHQASGLLQFEKAVEYRDQLKGLKKTLEYQSVVSEHLNDQDIFGLHRDKASVGIALLFIRGGRLTGVQTFFLADPLGEDAKILSQTILQFYSIQRQPPRELHLPLEIEDQDLIQERLAELREGPVSLSIPKRGKRMQLMQVAANNAQQIFSHQVKKEKAWNTLASTLISKLKLANTPENIECLDISNLQGKQAVGSLVSFILGDKNQKNYRHYKITGKDSPDDYAMMHEVLERRMEKGLLKDNLPDMFLLDGGKGQLHIGVEVLAKFKLLDKIDLVAIAKEKGEEGEKLFRPGRKNPILLPAHSPALLYLMQIRDESHRFGITFHRKLRNKSTLSSKLDSLSGVGPLRKKQMLQSMGSYKRILTATIEELTQIPGIGKELAQSIHSQLHGANNAS